MRKKSSYVWLAVFIASLISYTEVLADSKVTYHGRILRHDGSPVAGEVEFKIQIRTPGSENCVLFEETQTKDIANGIFALNIGEGSNQNGSLESTFQNRGTFTNLSGCEGSSTSYTAGVNDGRRLRVYFRESGAISWEQLPDTSINFFPLAIESQTVGGFSAKHLLRVVEEDGSTPAPVDPLTKSQYENLKDWLDDLIPGGGGGGGSGGVTSITVQPPLVVGGSATAPQISIPKADENTDGYLSSADWKKFDEKQSAGNYVTELTGDVVAQGPLGGGSATATIQDKAVTFVKIQDVSSGTILGRSSAGSGSVEEIAIGSGLNLSNGILSATGGGGGGSVTEVTSTNPYITIDNGTTTPEVTLHAGQGANTVAAGDDPRIVGAVQRTGDTMTGPLEVPGDGLKVGGAQLVATDGKIGIGTDSPSVLLDVAGTVKIGDGGETCSMAEDGGMIRYLGGNLQFCNGSTWQTLGVSGAGLQSLNGQTGSTQELKVEITGTAPKFTSASNVHTLELPMASSAGVTAGLISNSDYEAFSSKLTATLAAGHIFIGDGDDKAAAVLPSGDVTISQTGEVTVEGLRGRNIDATAPVAGQVPKYDDDNNAWTPSYLTVSDLRSGLGGIGAPQFPSSCSKSETLTWNAITDQFVCQSIEISSSQIADLGTMATKDVDDYLAKADNLAGLADPDTALANLGVTETGIALVKAQDATEARGVIEAMAYVAPGTDGHVLTVDNGNWVSAPLSINASNFGVQPQNYVLAGPASGGSGAPTFRSLVEADIPNLPATKITSGTLSSDVMPALSGDIFTSTGSTSATVVGLQGRSVANTAPSNGQVLKWSGTN